MKITSVYIHIPFCLRKCNYCDFVSYPVEGCQQFREVYVDLLLKELALYREEADFSQLRTIYFGGGTPSLMSAAEIARLLEALPAAVEITLEANPETLSAEKLREFYAVGINRLSMGVQSFKPRLLQAMGRGHSPQQAKDMVAAARAAGFANINIDLIYGLPQQSLNDWQEDVAEALALHTEHLSLYGLSVEEGTPWWEQQRRGELDPADQDLSADMLEYAIATLSDAGYHHYEISNFARPGLESQHNLCYWRRDNYLGLGVASAGCLLNYRYYNHHAWTDYQKALEKGDFPIYDQENLTIDQVIGEAVFLGLRLSEGINFNAFAEQYGVDLRKRYRRQLQRMAESGLLEIDEQRMRLSPRGVLLGNEVFMEFI